MHRVVGVEVIERGPGKEHRRGRSQLPDLLPQLRQGGLQDLRCVAIRQQLAGLRIAPKGAGHGTLRPHDPHGQGLLQPAARFLPQGLLDGILLHLLHVLQGIAHHRDIRVHAAAENDMLVNITLHAHHRQMQHGFARGHGRRRIGSGKEDAADEEPEDQHHAEVKIPRAAVGPCSLV